MERSSINQLDPARNWGLGYFRCTPKEEATIAVGVFHSGTDTFNLRSGEGSEAAVTARGTMLPWYEAEGRRLVHLGLALSSRFPEQGVVVINQRARSPLLDFGDSPTSPFLSTIRIPSDFQQLFNAQAAYVNGPFSAQAEWYGSWIAQNGGPSVFFDGGYLQVSCFLTGEQRSYQKQNGVFGGVTVNRPVSGFLLSNRQVTSTGAGAWEVTARAGYLNFFDSHTPRAPQGELVGVRLAQARVGGGPYAAHVQLFPRRSRRTQQRLQHRELVFIATGTVLVTAGFKVRVFFREPYVWERTQPPHWLTQNAGARMRSVFCCAAGKRICEEGFEWAAWRKSLWFEERARPPSSNSRFSPKLSDSLAGH